MVYNIHPLEEEEETHCYAGKISQYKNNLCSPTVEGLEVDSCWPPNISVQERGVHHMFVNLPSIESEEKLAENLRGRDLLVLDFGAP